MALQSPAKTQGYLCIGNYSTVLVESQDAPPGVGGNGKADGIPLLKYFGTIWHNRIKENMNEILNNVIRTEKKNFYKYEPSDTGITFDAE